jgi:cation transport regulator ChaB
LATYKVLYWYDIPSQVRAEDEHGRVGKQLPAHFQEAIDDAAMSAKLIGSDAYMDGFHWGEEMERAGTAEEVAAAVVEEISVQHPEWDWKASAKKIKEQAQE